MRTFAVAALLLFAAIPAHAQSAAPPSNPLVGSVRGTYDIVKDYIVRAADKMPEEHYSFSPTPEVRNYGQLIGHVANANYMICSSAKGEANPNQGKNLEETTAKADLIAALNASFAYCDGAFALSDAEAAAPVDFFTGPSTRLGVLAFNTAHDFEHYGNMVTYLRIKGLVPPSSERSGG